MSRSVSDDGVHQQLQTTKLSGDDGMGRFAVELKWANSADAVLVHRGLLSPGQVRQTEIQGVVDTGVIRLVIPEHVVTELGGREVDEI